MDAPWDQSDTTRGPALLLEHCAAFERLDEVRPSARERLRHVIGNELAGLLLRALAGDQRRGARRLLG